MTNEIYDNFLEIKTLKQHVACVKHEKYLFQGHISVTMINSYQNGPYMQSLAVQTKMNNESDVTPSECSRRCPLFVGVVFSLLCEGHRFHPSPASRWIRSV